MRANIALLKRYESFPLFLAAAISLSLHLLALVIVFAVTSQSFNHTTDAGSLPIIKVTLVSSVMDNGAKATGAPSEQTKGRAFAGSEYDRAADISAGEKHSGPETPVEHKQASITFLETTTRIGDTHAVIHTHQPLSSPGEFAGQTETAKGRISPKGAGADSAAAAGSSTSAATLPRYRSTPHPAYPSLARTRGYEGLVLISAEVREDGRVGEARIRKSSGYYPLDQSALEAVKGWKFEPARKTGIPIIMWVDIPIKFSLSGHDG